VTAQRVRARQRLMRGRGVEPKDEPEEERGH
jgi:hypothetical protein